MKVCLSSVLACLVLAAVAHAQQPQIGSYTPPTVNPRPILSPYLNINRGGAAPAVNYYGIVRPQIENQQAIQQLQQFQGNQPQYQQPVAGNQTGTEEMATTGHVAGGYFNYLHYFPLYNRGGGGGTGINGTTLTVWVNVRGMKRLIPPSENK